MLYYVILWSLSDSHHIFKVIKKYEIFGKTKLLNIKCVFLFSLRLLSETFHILKRTQQDITINLHTSSCKVTYSWQILIKLQQTSEKYSNIKFHKNLSSGNWVVPCGQMDRHCDAKSHFHHFADTSKKVLEASYFGPQTRVTSNDHTVHSTLKLGWSNWKQCVLNVAFRLPSEQQELLLYTL